MLYWTDRGNPPLGNTVNPASIDAPGLPGPKPDIVVSDLPGAAAGSDSVAD
jgi:hypothetical protein